MLRAAGLPWLCSNASGERDITYDCQDIEQSATDLVVTQVIVEADVRYSGYAECNVDASTAGKYECECRNNSAPSSHRHHHVTEPCNATVGRIAVVNESSFAHAPPDNTDPDPFRHSIYAYVHHRCSAWACLAFMTSHSQPSFFSSSLALRLVGSEAPPLLLHVPSR